MKILILILSILAAWQSTLIAQIAQIEDNGTYVLHCQIGAPVNLDVAIPADASSTSWAYAITGGGSGSCAFAAAPCLNTALGFGLSFNFYNNRVEIRGTATAPVGTEPQLDFTLTASESGKTRLFRLVIRKPRDLVFVLDRSGSMECGAGTSWSGCDANALSNRWHILSNAVDNFIAKIDNQHKLETDRMSVVYFDGTTLNNNALLTHDGMPFRTILDFRGSASPTVLKTEMLSSPVSTPQLGGMTSIGAGLLKAFQRFGASPNPVDSKKIIYLFSDGQQNTNQWVVESGANTGKVIQMSQSNTSGAINMNDAYPDVDRYSSALIIPPSGAASAASVALATVKAIGSSTENYTNVMAGDEVSVASDFATNAFNKIYGQFSPQLVRYDKKNLASGGNVSSTFNCNKNVNRVIFEAYFDQPIGRRVRHRILKDGVDVTAKGTPLSINEHIRSIAFNMYAISDLKSEGKWTFEIIGGSDDNRTSVSVAKVSLFATADDHQVRFKGQLSKEKIRVKDAINPIATLFEQGKAVTNATIKAIILKPGDDIGDILARSSVNVPTPTDPQSYSNCGDRKYDYLQATNPAALAQLKNIQSNTINLTHQGGGVYSGTYNNVDVSGTYKVQYIVNYTSPTLGEVERLIEQTINVTFPTIDWELTVPKKAVQSSNDGQSSLSTTLRPAFTVNGKTRYVGPGFQNALSVNNPNVRLYGVTDNCDGSYELTLSSRNLSERIDLYLTDKVIYSGRAKDLITGVRGFGLSAHAGLAFPTANFKNRVNTGFYGELDATYRFSSQFSVDAVGGYYAFSSNVMLLAATLNLVGQLPISNNWEAHLSVGAGPYKRPNQTAKTGTVGRLSVGKLLKQRYFISIEAAKHQVKDDDIDFLTAGLGLKFYF